MGTVTAHPNAERHGTRRAMTRICNFPISKSKRCKQPIIDDKPNCGRHKIDLSADQLGQSPTVYQKDGTLHVWAGDPDGLYCLIHNDPAYQVLYQVAGETPPCCLRKAIKWTDGDGRLHRDGGPARVWPSGTQEWYQHGECHRDDGPAMIELDGTQRWYQHGEWHRDDGPAIIRNDGAQEWYQHNKFHRDGSPAVIKADGTLEWWQHGERHRDDGPAVIKADGTQYWYQHGKLHREDGPAMIEADGTQEWRQYGVPHRKDGPALIWPSGTQEWYLHGWHITEEEHAMMLKRYEDT